MPIYGEKFVYGNKQLTEGEERMARTRAEFTLWGKQQARRFAEAKKRPRQAVGNKAADEAVVGQEDEVRRSLYLPTGFLEHLMGHEEFFLHYLRGHYGVSIMVPLPKKRIHIKGPKSKVMACYTCMKELLLKWHQHQAGDQ
ncbi:hypothetical protein E2C01_046674 [Portunus trituberculatus]|uniref:Uncharacterized protein n=1 Tax=Portunus trituberculatus TaxID=210409 RepID=A0A5B7G5S1_PORTR|nr:hypothetical protein [Portunus trituberculatus]